MNELQLSKDINVITAEINSYKQVAGQAIFEIGRRLKHVKENDLVHGEFGKWLETIDFNQSQASRFIKIYEELGDTNLLTSAKVGFRNLLEIATLPQEEREKEHTLDSGETKTVDEMTVRELQEVKRKLRESEQAKQQAETRIEIERKERERLEIENEELANREPQIIEKEVVREVVPSDYEQTKQERDRILQELNLLKKAQEIDHESEIKKIKALELEANKTVLTTKIKIDEFLKDVAVTAFRRGAIASSSEGTRQNLQQGIDELKNFIREMEMALNGRIEA